MSRFNLAAATVLVSCLAVTGCGSSSSSDTSAATPAQPQGSYTSKAVFDAAAKAKLPEAIRKAGVIKAVTTSNFPPFASAGSNGTLTGLDIDLAQALSTVLGVQVKMDSAATVAAFIPGLQSGRWDTAISPMADTTVRQKQVDFVDYYTGGSTLTFLKTNPGGITHLSDTCGKNVAVAQASEQIGLVDTQSSKCQTAGKAPIKAVVLPDNPSCLLAVRSGKADAAFIGEEPIAAYLKNSSDLTRDTESYAVGLSGIAVLKDNTAPATSSSPCSRRPRWCRSSPAEICSPTRNRSTRGTSSFSNCSSWSASGISP